MNENGSVTQWNNWVCKLKTARKHTYFYNYVHKRHLEWSSNGMFIITIP